MITRKDILESIIDIMEVEDISDKEKLHQIEDILMNNSDTIFEEK